MWRRDNGKCLKCWAPRPAPSQQSTAGDSTASNTEHHRAHRPHCCMKRSMQRNTAQPIWLSARSHRHCQHHQRAATCQCLTCHGTPHSLPAGRLLDGIACFSCSVSSVCCPHTACQCGSTTSASPACRWPEVECCACSRATPALRCSCGCCCCWRCLVQLAQRPLLDVTAYSSVTAAGEAGSVRPPPRSSCRRPCTWSYCKTACNTAVAAGSVLLDVAERQCWRPVLLCSFGLRSIAGAAGCAVLLVLLDVPLCWCCWMRCLMALCSRAAAGAAVLQQ